MNAKEHDNEGINSDLVNNESRDDMNQTEDVQHELNKDEILKLSKKRQSNYNAIIKKRFENRGQSTDGNEMQLPDIKSDDSFSITDSPGPK
jgi:hypothetical protein